MKVVEGAVAVFYSDPGFTGQKVPVNQSLSAGGMQFSCVQVHEVGTKELDDEELDLVVGGVAEACGGDVSGVSSCTAYTCGGAGNHTGQYYGQGSLCLRPVQGWLEAEDLCGGRSRKRNLSPEIRR